MPLPFKFDFKKPDYIMVLEWRVERYVRLLRHPKQLEDLKEFYKNDPAQFIIDWGMTLDPRNVERNQPTYIPFLLFPRQEEWVHWFIDCWRRQVPGITAKSREMGITWLSVGVASTLCLFHDGMAVGFGSRKQEYVDKLGDPKSILHKVRQFVGGLPPLFRGTWDVTKHAPHMRVQFPDTDSIITGEAGDGIGRGDRTGIYIVDESAYLPRPDLVEASLSQTTNCRHDLSTPWGMNNPFARKWHDPERDKFRFHWRDDPRKDQAWYDKKCKDIGDPVVIAQELDLDFSASVEGIVIPQAHVLSAIDAHIKLGFKPSGIRKAGLDIAGQGKDLNAFCGRYGVVIEFLESWSGVGGSIYATVQRAISLCDTLGYDSVDYDSCGVGEGVGGDAEVLNAKRAENGIVKIRFEGFNSAEGVVDPEGDPSARPGALRANGSRRTNLDFFANRKAQAWWALRRRFEMTHRYVNGDTEGISLDDIISLPSRLPELSQLMIELSQPTYSENNAGKILINKTPDGGLSPNLADAVMIVFAPPAVRPRGILECL